MYCIYEYVYACIWMYCMYMYLLYLCVCIRRYMYVLYLCTCIVFMCMYMFVCECIVCICMYCIYVYVYVCICMYLLVSKLKYVCVCIVCICMYVHVSKILCISDTYTYIQYIHIWTYIHNIENLYVYVYEVPLRTHTDFKFTYRHILTGRFADVLILPFYFEVINHYKICHIICFWPVK